MNMPIQSRLIEAPPWTPLPYMRRAVDFLKGHRSAGLPLKPGAAKTAITLKAFSELRAEGIVKTMLVVAPLRVARQTWRQEANKWADFRGLRFALVHGDAKVRSKALRSGADVYLINPEGVAWLAEQYGGRPLPFDVVAIDELTKFMNSQADRFKALRPRLGGAMYRWGLTGSFFAKGHLNIFGQQLILDDGAALGRYFTHFRDRYFHADFTGFNYELLPGAEQAILDKLAPYWFYMSEADYAQLPPLIDVPRIAEMDPHQRGLYTRMKNEMLLTLPQGEVEAANAGAAYSKLSQMANGAVYMADRTVAPIHELKLDMVEELLDELNGEPLLLAYEFNHDLERLQKRFGSKEKPLPYLGQGTTPRQENDWVTAWNRGELPLLLAHPQSAGHGLNMQGANAYNVAWFSVPWDWELYDQFIRRLRRTGNEAARIFNHLLIVRDTMDELKLEAVRNKDFTERHLLAGLNNRILREAQEQPGDSTMIARLSRPGQGQAAPQQAQQPQQPQQAQAQGQAPQGANGGWGGQPAAPQAQEGQRERIQQQIAPQDRASAAAAAFGGQVQESIAQVGQADYGTTDANNGAGGAPANGGWGGQASQQASNTAPFDTTQAGQAAAPDKPKRTRAAKADAGGDQTIATVDVLQASRDNVLLGARASVLAAVIQTAEADASVEDIVDIARDLMQFVEQG